MLLAWGYLHQICSVEIISPGSYLYIEDQLVSVNGVQSDLMQLCCGVTQGEPVWPLAIIATTWLHMWKTNCSCIQMLAWLFPLIRTQMWITWTELRFEIWTLSKFLITKLRLDNKKRQRYYLLTESFYLNQFLSLVYQRGWFAPVKDFSSTLERFFLPQQAKRLQVIVRPSWRSF